VHHPSPTVFAAAAADTRQPVLAAWGAGVDSTAMLTELVARGERVDAVLFANTGSENPLTYRFLPVFIGWLQDRGVPVHIVRYQPKNFKNYPPYATLEENCLTNGTLPSKTFGFGSCSIKWKASPQDAWTKTWRPAIDAWAAGLKVIKLIGYDCSPADSRRYAEAEGHTQGDGRYEYRYPLREWGWTREDCIARIAAEGLPVPPKSSCFFCPAMKPHEVAALRRKELRRIVLMEAVKGTRGATPRPGSMTEYIRAEGLLPADEIDAIITAAPQALIRFSDAAGQIAAGDRPPLASWVETFDRLDFTYERTP
jgi:3'-phosphoadenosine 5'-phosphosulfate sulfotransferase (PAPS reductase)/FAD synthetase